MPGYETTHESSHVGDGLTVPPPPLQAGALSIRQPRGISPPEPAHAVVAHVFRSNGQLHGDLPLVPGHLQADTSGSTSSTRSGNRPIISRWPANREIGGVRLPLVGVDPAAVL